MDGGNLFIGFFVVSVEVIGKNRYIELMECVVIIS